MNPAPPVTRTLMMVSEIGPGVRRALQSGTLADAHHHPRPARRQTSPDGVVEQSHRGVVEVEAGTELELEPDARPAREPAAPFGHLVVHRGGDQELLHAAVLAHAEPGLG